MLKLIGILINILCVVQIIICNQIVIDDPLIDNDKSNQTDALVFQAIELFDKLKQLEITTLENINKLNSLSKDQVIAKTKLNDNYDSQFKKEIENLQNSVTPKLAKGLDFKNCPAEMSKDLEVLYANENAYPNIMMTESQLQQDKIVKNYTRQIEDLFLNGIEEFKMSFLNPDSMNITELTTFNQHFEIFLFDINEKVDNEYRNAYRGIQNTTAAYRANLDEKLTKIKDRINTLINTFEMCMKDVEIVLLNK